jgi:ferritin
MKLEDKMLKELNQQINAEFWSAYLYLSMSAWFKGQNLEGFANWMEVQNKEEQTHGMKIFNYLYERNAKVTLEPIKAVPVSWKSPSDAFRSTLEHEQQVTASIYHLMDTAIECKDYATQSFLKWFIDEQVEEESSARDIMTILEQIETNEGALRMLDKEYLSRK